MLLFGHSGITLGGVLLLRGAVRHASPITATENGGNCLSKRATTGPPASPRSTHRVVQRFVLDLDYRLILLGSMLPDIIDKPVGIYLLGNTFGNGRIFAHTLLLVVIVGLIGVYLYQSQGKAWLVTLSFGSLFHLFEDQMWLTPRTFFWPAYGWAFEKTDTSSWLQNIFYAVRTNPAVYVPELIGGHHNDEFCSQGGSF